ncbi:triose-phosphate isomerase [Oenococcus sicerae]|uniref:Triosephosphate isomerase n=1 Tax=Oenococcus sicerae TaxID=2203724 RepID=A0AAJ1VQQ8_9LACO|nr:triose-phosphate isomerase [Oenococcus sicerae]MDN6900487.1 triose-phosphate isomerase [Oenococcus sicerae]QAS69491.1 triose-phosphate isomerase [Oenococcus sicerae]VDK13382.1 Triosephosphate isomerase {ECO:0000255/HAMAP-Rule:MF_00147} [Oenococcus sicerae]
MRKPIIIANWKMNFLRDQADQYVAKLIKKLKNDRQIEVAIASQDLFLPDLIRIADETPVSIVAQNAHWENFGPFTGETSPKALANIGVDYVMLGHFERRELFNETNSTVNLKVRTALNNGMNVIVDVEELEQVAPVLEGVLEEQMQRIMIGFEPTFAIGTGMSASTKGAEDVAAQIRKTIKKLYGINVADATRILYGGSVNRDNLKDLINQVDIDGVLVGKAALDFQTFWELVQIVQRADQKK